MKGKSFFKSKWMILISVLLVLCIAGGVVALNFNNWFGSEEETAVSVNNSIFWNLDRYDYAKKSEKGASSRPIDKNDGYYHVLFANEGRQVTRRVADEDVLNEVDAHNVMGLTFDSEGIITGVREISELDREVLYFNFYVNLVDGNNISINSSYRGGGVLATFTKTAATKIYDISGGSGEQGIPVTEIKENDRIVVLANTKGEVTEVYITETTEFGTVYWNVERKWDYKLGISTREADADGLYSFLLAVNGKQKIYRTKLPSVASAMDAKDVGCFGLIFDNDGYITSVLNAVKVFNGTSVSNYNVTAINENEVTLENIITTSTNYGDVQTVTLHKSCKVYDVSGMGDFIGVSSELKVNDRVYMVRDSHDRVVYAYIKSRSWGGPMYYNLTNFYDSKISATTRQTDAEGYYVFTMAANGSVHTLKTKDKAIANRIDAYAARCMGLKLDGDIILAVYSPLVVEGCEGSSLSGYQVTAINGNSFTAEKTSGTNKGEIINVEMTPDCKVYIVGGNYSDHLGELSKLEVSDTIHCYKNKNGQVTVIFVKSRSKGAVVKTAYCEHCGRVVDWFGYRSAGIISSGHYVLIGDNLNASQANIGTDGKSGIDVVLDLNGHVISAEKRIFYMYKDCSFTLLDSVGTGTVTTTVSNDQATDIGYAVYVRDNSTFTLISGTIDTGALISQKSGAAVYARTGSQINIKGGKLISGSTLGSGSAVYMMSNSIFNMTGGYITGGNAKTNGGTVYLSSGADFNMSGGTVEGGSAKLGGALYIPSGFKMSGGAITGGTAASGGAIYFASTANSEITGGTVKSGTANGQGGNIYNRGNLTVSGGTVKNGTAVYTNNSGGHGGNIYNSGALTITGGTIEGGVSKATSTQGGGGNIAINSAAAFFTMTGGTVKNGSASRTNTGNILAVVASGNLALDIGGGTVTDDAEFVPANGYSAGGLYLKNATLNLSGSPNITGNKGSNVYVDSGALILPGTLSDRALIGVTVANSSAVFAKNASEYIASFISDNTSLSVVTDGTDLKLSGPYFDEDKYLIEENGTLALNCHVSDVLYQSSDEKVAIIDENGNVTAISAGVADITVASGTFVAKCRVVVGHVHCLECGTYGCTEHTNVVFTAVSGTSIPKTGNYYIKDDLVLTTTQTNVDANKTLNLCLNGHSVTADGTRAIVANGTGSVASICDCSEEQTGVIKGENYTDNVGGILRAAKGTVNIYSGTVDCSSLNNGTRNCSGVYVGISTDTTAKFNMYGGTVKGGNAGRGGSIYILANATANIIGGTVTGGTAAEGGNIYVAANGVLNLSGGTVNGGTADRGGGVFAAGSVNVSGSTKVIGNHNTSFYADDIYIPDGKTVSVGENGLAADSRIGIRMVSAGTFLNDSRASYFESNFLSNDGQYTVSAYGSELKLDTQGISMSSKMLMEPGVSKQIAAASSTAITWTSADTSVATVDSDGNVTPVADYGAVNIIADNGITTKVCRVVIGHYHCIECGTFGCENPEHHNKIFKEWISTTLLPKSAVDAGAWYLSSDISCGQQTVAANTDIYLCLNGKTANGTGQRLYQVNGTGCSLNVTDCDPYQGGTLSINDFKDNIGGVVRVGAGTFNLYRGTVDGSSIDNSGKNCAGVYVGITTAATARFNMYGGTVKGGTANLGGSVYVIKDAVFNLYGGTITGGSAVQGGNIYVASGGEVNISGSTITGGTASEGGNIYISAGANVTVSGGTVTKGTATSNGGGIFLPAGADINLSGKPAIVDNTKHDILLVTATSTITLGELTNGADIGIAMGVPGVFATGLTSDISGYFHATSTGFSIIYEDGSLKLSK